MRVKLGDIASIKHGFAFSGESICEEDNGIVLVTPGNFSIGGGFQEEKCKFYTGEIPRDYVLSPGDLIVTMTDLSKGIDTLGYGALVPFTGRIYLHNQRIGLVEIKDSSVDKGYLARVLQTREYQKTIAGTSSGSTVHHTSPSKIESYSFELPDLKTQRRIAGVLSAYDELIENSCKQIKLLEEAAQRLYKEWFVDLRFPGHETTPIVDGFPEGWHMGSLLDLVDVVRGCSYSSDEIVSGGKTLINLGNLTPFGGFRFGYAKPYSGKSRDDQTVVKGDVIMGLTEQATGLAGYAALLPTIPNNSVISADLLKLVPHPGVPAVFVYAVLRFGRLSELISPLANGTKIKHLRPESLPRATVLLPPKRLASDYARLVAPFYDQISTCNQRMAAAREARDRLLPKLMSGEIEV